MYLNKSPKSNSITFTHIWTIENFAHLYDDDNQWKWQVESELFTPPKNDALKFCLTIWPKVTEKDGEEYVAFGLGIEEVPAMWEGKMTMKEKRWIVDQEGKKLHCKEYQEKEVFANRGTRDPKYLPVVKLFDPSFGYLRRNKLTLMIEITLFHVKPIFNKLSNTNTFSSITVPISVSGLSHRLSIAHFKWLVEDKTRPMPLKVESQYFALKKEDVGRMQLEFFPKGDTGTDEENVDIGIRNNNTDSLMVHYELSLLDETGNRCYQDVDTYRMPSQSSRFYTLPRRDLLHFLSQLPLDQLTIDCQVKFFVNGTSDNKFPNTPFSTYIDLALFTYHNVSYTWKIEKISKFVFEQRHNLMSAFFFPSTAPKYKFSLRVYSKGTIDENKRSVDIALFFDSPLKNDASMETKVNWRRSIVDANGEEWNSTTEGILISENGEIGPYQLISRQALNDFASLLIPDDKLIIRCKIWIHEPRMELPSEPLSFLPAKNPFASVSSGVPINHENFIIATPKTPGSGLPILQNAVKKVKLFENKQNEPASILARQLATTTLTRNKSTSLTFTHRWTIDNFSYLYDNNCPWKWGLESECFSLPNNEVFTFSLIIKPREKENMGIGWQTLEIPAMLEGMVVDKTKIMIVDEKRRELFVKEYAEREVFRNLKLIDLEYVPIENLLDITKGYLRMGTLSVITQVTLNSSDRIFNQAQSSIFGHSHTTVCTSVSSLSHSFTLSHFKWLSEDNTKQMPLKVESNYFEPERKDIGRIRIVFYPMEQKGKDEETVCIGIRNDNKDSLLVHCEFSLLGANGLKFHHHVNTYKLPPNIGGFHSLPRRLLLSFLDSQPTDELTINYQVTVLAKGEQDKAPSPFTHTTTHIDLALFTFHYVPFTWTIEQFPAQLKRRAIESKIFSFPTDSRYQFNLRLYPKEKKKNITLELRFISSYAFEKSKFNWRFSVIDANGDEWNAITKTDFVSNTAQFGPHKLITHRTLDNYAALLLSDNQLTIKSELWIHESFKQLPSDMLNPLQAKDSVASSFSRVPRKKFGNITITNSNLYTNSIIFNQSSFNTSNITLSSVFNSKESS